MKEYMCLCILFLFSGEMQRIAFSPNAIVVCVCASMCLCVYAAFADLGKTV